MVGEHELLAALIRASTWWAPWFKLWHLRGPLVQGVWFFKAGLCVWENHWPWWLWVSTTWTCPGAAGTCQPGGTGGWWSAAAGSWHQTMWPRGLTSDDGLTWPRRPAARPPDSGTSGPAAGDHHCSGLSHSASDDNNLRNFILNKLFEYDKESSRPLYNDMKSLYFPEARGRTRCRLTEQKRLGFGGGSAEPGHCPFWKNVFDWVIFFTNLVITCKVALNGPTMMWWLT